MNTLEARRDAYVATQVRPLAYTPGYGSHTAIKVKEAQLATVWDDFVAYFDEHEPAVADAIRYGVTRINNYGLQSNHAFLVNYPEGHPKR